MCRRARSASVLRKVRSSVRADVFAICSNPGPNNSCVTASGGKPVFYQVSRSVSMSASPTGPPYMSGNSKVVDFSGHADWTSASYLQLLWVADWMATKTLPASRFVSSGQIQASGEANINRIGLTPGRTLAEVRIWACPDKESITFFGVDADECCPGCSCFGGPITPSSGNMRYADTDPLPSIGGTSLARTYNSKNTDAGWFGAGWSSFLDEWLRVEDESDGSTTVLIGTAEDNRRVFHGTGSLVQVWPQDSRRGVLRSDGLGGYVLREYGSDVERYFSAPTQSTPGRIYKIRQLSTGRDLTVDYDGNGQITHVGDSWGSNGWTVTEDTSGRISSIAVDGTSIAWTYGYDTSGRLHTVSQGAGVWRTYNYNGQLTEVRDAAGHLIEGHAYGADGATSSLGDSDDVTNVEYNIATADPAIWITRVTYGTGAQTLYYNKHIAGRPRVDHIDGGCGSCSNKNAVYAYDDRGRTFREQNARGYVTERAYDDRDRVLTETSALVPTGCDPETDSGLCRRVGTLGTVSLSPTTASLTNTFTYGGDPWYDRPLSVATASVLNSSGTRTETMTYEAQTGVLLTRTITGWTGSTGSPQQETHTTTNALYDGTEGAAFDPGGAFNSAWLTLPQPRLLKSSDGPRTDVSDLTRWVYYPVDQAVPTFLRGRLAAVRDPAGHTTRFESYDAFGNPGRTIDANGVTTEYTYDATGRVLTSTLKGVSGCNTSIDPLCTTDLTSSRTYQSTFGPVASQTRPNGATTTYEYDDRTRLTAMVRSVSTTLSERLEYDYDTATGQKSAERYRSGQPGSWTTAKSEAFRYNTEGRLIAVDHPDGKSILYTYDPANNLATVQDENHTSANTTYKYDPVNRLIRVTQTLSTATSGTIATQYAYDLHGNLTSVTDPNGNVTTYTFDDFGRMRRQVSPVTGTTTYTYDPASNLVSTTDANNATTARVYDALNRVTSATSSRSGLDTEIVTYTYDATSQGRYGIGRLSTMDGTSYSYERRGLLTAVADDDGLTTTFGYDADGNRSSLGYPSGRVVGYTFDLAGRPITASSAGASIVNSAAYLPFGPLSSVAYGNGTTRTTLYDARYRPQENKLSTATAVIADYLYQEDAVGNITQIHDATNAAYNRDFGYDDLNRLTTANSGASLWGTGSYQYDAMGNMTALHIGARSLSFSYVGTTPRIQSVSGTNPATVAYDSAGNDLSSGTYSARNLLHPAGGGGDEMPDPGQQSPHLQLSYDGRGVRIGSSVTSPLPPPWGGTSTRRSIYSPELSLLAQYDTSGFVLEGAPPEGTDYIWFGGQPVAQAFTDLAQPLRYTFTDHLGTPLLQTVADAAVAWRAEYEPYGSVYVYRVADADDPQALRLPGQEAADPMIGLEYNIFRWYRSSWGRYTQVDPLHIPTALYGYPQNPLWFTDRLALLRVNHREQVEIYMDPDDWRQHCPPQLQAAGACSMLGLTVICHCKSDGDCWTADPDLNIEGELNIFGGDYSDLGTTPKDLNVHDQRTAIDHEYGRHIDVAVDAAVRTAYAKLGSAFTDEQACINNCVTHIGDIRNAFFDALKRTQLIERRMPPRH